MLNFNHKVNINEIELDIFSFTKSETELAQFNVPEPIANHIFSFFSFTTLNEAKLVSRSWYSFAKKRLCDIKSKLDKLKGDAAAQLTEEQITTLVQDLIKEGFRIEVFKALINEISIKLTMNFLDKEHNKQKSFESVLMKTFGLSYFVFVCNAIGFILKKSHDQETLEQMQLGDKFVSCFFFINELLQRSEPDRLTEEITWINKNFSSNKQELVLKKDNNEFYVCGAKLSKVIEDFSKKQGIFGHITKLAIIDKLIELGLLKASAVTTIDQSIETHQCRIA